MAKVSGLVVVLGTVALLGGVAIISKPNEQAHVEKLVKVHGPGFVIGVGLGNAVGLAKTVWKDHWVYSTYESVAADGKTHRHSWGAFGYVGVMGK